MKKLFLALFFAVLGFASMAQTITVNMKAKDKNGKPCMHVHVDYSLKNKVKADLLLYVLDLDGDLVKSRDSGYADSEGHLCTYLLEREVWGNKSSCDFYIPMDVLYKSLDTGFYNAWFMMSDSETENDIMSGRKQFYLD